MPVYGSHEHVEGVHNGWPAECQTCSKSRREAASVAKPPPLPPSFLDELFARVQRGDSVAEYLAPRLAQACDRIGRYCRAPSKDRHDRVLSALKTLSSTPGSTGRLSDDDIDRTESALRHEVGAMALPTGEVTDEVDAILSSISGVVETLRHPHAKANRGDRTSELEQRRESRKRSSFILPGDEDFR